MDDKNYIRKVNDRRLKSFAEYKHTVFSAGATAILATIFILNGYDFSNKSLRFGFLCAAALYAISLIYQLVLLKIMRSQILKTENLSSLLRLNGIIMVLFVFSGNIFMFDAGMMLLNKNKTIEFQLCTYMLLTNICIILVSLLNIFKDYVSNDFFIGIAVLAAISLFYVVVSFITAKCVTAKTINKKTLWLVLPLLATAATGNIFAIVLAVILYKRSTQKNADISIQWIDIMRRLFRNQTAVIGFFIIVFFISLSVCSRMTFDYDTAIDNNYSALLLSPSLKYPFGTDNFGRCVFTRIVFGAKISLLVGLAATVYPMVIGGVLGAIAGYYGGKTDNIIMRALDILYAIPSLLLSIVIIASLGANLFNLILALGVSSIAGYARIVRATVLNLSSVEFVEAAKAYGATDRIIVFKHIIPNSLAPIIVSATISLGGVVLSTSALSYLGIGIAPHLPEWGNILRMGSPYLETHSFLAIFPGLAIITIVLAFNFFGDGVRDALDPKLK